MSAMAHRTLDLYGGDQPWDAALWETSDDRVRGGSSRSYFTVPAPDRGRFSGHLDTTTLGGAGFASQHTAGELCLDLSGYDGLLISVAEPTDAAAMASHASKRYTVTLKDDLPSKRPDGREQAGVSWEASFAWGPQDGGAQIFLPWIEFKPTYRGRDKPDAEPLKLAAIRRIGLMMRSFFGGQDGDFQIDLQAIAVRGAGGDSLGVRSEPAACAGACRGGVDDEATNHEEDEEDEDDLETQKRKAASQHQQPPLSPGAGSGSRPSGWRRLLCGLL